MEKMIVITNEKEISKGVDMIAIMNKMSKYNKDIYSHIKECNQEVISLNDFKKSLLKCKSIDSECKIFEDVYCIVLLSIPTRYEDFIINLFYDERSMDKFFEYYCYRRVLFIYDNKKDKLERIEEE